jgi:DNA (cytosine-5)-methyltransferase 1
MDNQQGTDGGLRELALFAGAGGGILGGHLLGWRTVCAVEYDPYAGSVLIARQNDGILAPFPVWDDVCTFDGKPWRGIVDVVSGGFPCQDISAAGKGAGITGERSGLWKEMARIIGEVRPRYVFVENSPMLAIRGLGVVLGDLAQMGFDADWGVLGASDVGAPHIRKRIWIFASNPYSGDGSPQQKCKHQRAKKLSGSGNGEMGSLMAHTQRAPGIEQFEPALQRGWQEEAQQAWMGRGGIDATDWWETEPDVGGKFDGLA